MREIKSTDSIEYHLEKLENLIDEAYRRLKCPKSYLDENCFRDIMAHKIGYSRGKLKHLLNKTIPKLKEKFEERD